MQMHRLLYSPILLVVLIFFAIAVIIVIVDVIRYFGYYFRNRWTEATWIDDLTGASQHDQTPDEAQPKRSKAPAKK